MYIIDTTQAQEQEGDGVILLNHLIVDNQELKETLVLSHFEKCLALEAQGFPCKWGFPFCTCTSHANRLCLFLLRLLCKELDCPW